MRYRYCQCWYSGPKILPTAHTSGVELSFIAHFQVPAAPHLSFLLDITHMRFQQPSETLDLLRFAKVRNEGPIVLMMLARKNCPTRPKADSGLEKGGYPLKA